MTSRITRDEVMHIANQAAGQHWGSEAHLQRFAALLELRMKTSRPEGCRVAIERARREEREACEALHEHEDVLAPVGQSAWGEAYQEGWIAGVQAYRDAIRARGLGNGEEQDAK